MCEAIVFLSTQGIEKEIMRDVLILETLDNHLFLTNLFGDQKELQARIKNIDFSQHKVLLEEI